MSLQYYACINDSDQLFKGHEEVMKHVLKAGSEEQKQVFFKYHDFDEIVEGCSSFFEDQCICTEGRTLYLRNEYLHKHYTLTVMDDHVIINTEEENPFVAYLIRYERTWCAIDENQRVHWLGYCQSN